MPVKFYIDNRDGECFLKPIAGIIKAVAPKREELSRQNPYICTPDHKPPVYQPEIPGYLTNKP